MICEMTRETEGLPTVVGERESWEEKRQWAKRSLHCHTFEEKCQQQPGQWRLPHLASGRSWGCFWACSLGWGRMTLLDRGSLEIHRRIYETSEKKSGKSASASCSLSPQKRWRWIVRMIYFICSNIWRLTGVLVKDKSVLLSPLEVSENSVSNMLPSSASILWKGSCWFIWTQSSLWWIYNFIKKKTQM